MSHHMNRVVDGGARIGIFVKCIEFSEYDDAQEFDFGIESCTSFWIQLILIQIRK